MGRMLSEAGFFESLCHLALRPAEMSHVLFALRVPCLRAHTELALSGGMALESDS